MTDSEIKRLLSTAATCLPVPWEQLWVIFQKVIQQSQDKRITMKEDFEKEEKSTKLEQ